MVLLKGVFDHARILTDEKFIETLHASKIYDAHSTIFFEQEVSRMGVGVEHTVFEGAFKKPFSEGQSCPLLGLLTRSG